MVDDTEHIGSLKEKLIAVSNEIDTLKNSFSKSAQDLSRIQSMLSVQNLEELSNILQRFESKVAEEERKRSEATDGAKRYSEELEKEKERLIKLWDAYKNQEEELSASEKKVVEYEERARMVEASKKQLEDDLTARINTLSQKLEENESKANQYNDYKQKWEESDFKINQIEQELNTLKEENNNKQNVINDLNDQINKLNAQENYTEYKEKYESMAAEYEKEKERLTKLYHLYEETDHECKRLTEENNNWQRWYNSNKEIFNTLFSSTPPIGSSVEETPSYPTIPEEQDERKPKKKFKFGK